MNTLSKVIQEMEGADQNKSGMFELGEDTMCALMDLLTKERGAAVPVGEVILGDYDDCGDYPDAKAVCIAAQGHADWSNFKNGTKLYTAPPAQPFAVPEAWTWEQANGFIRRKEINFPVEAAHSAVEAYRAALINGSPEQDPDTLALAVAEKIMALMHQRHIGGDCQLLAKIQCLILDEMGLRRG